jgi:hypothetical protein
MVQEETLGFRARRAIVRLITFAIVVALAAVAVFLLAKLNARTYRVQFADGNLKVMKGKNQPLGFEPYRPADPVLADAYAAIPIRGDPPVDIVSRTFQERDELDRALFTVFETLGKPRLFSEDPQEIQEGLYYLRRAEKLTGITEEQRRSLKTMQSDIAYHLGREKLDDARRVIAEAMTQLRIAADSLNRNSRSANQMLLEVGPAAKALEEALRRAVYNLSAPLSPPRDVASMTDSPSPEPTRAEPNRAGEAPRTPEPHRTPEPGRGASADPPRAARPEPERTVRSEPAPVAVPPARTPHPPHPTPP